MPREKTRTGKEKLEKGTTQQALWQLVEKTDTPLELPQRQGEKSSRTKPERQKDAVRNALRYLDDLGVFKDERPENKTNTRYWIFTLTLKHKDASIEENLGVVKQKLGLETSPLEEDAGTLPLSLWQECCRKMLPTALSINPLLHGDGVVLTIEDIVPLELVERKQRPQQEGDFSPEHFQVQAPTEYETPVEHDKFLAQVLETGGTLKNQDRKIAVIGEPGAGKTTLLQEIAKEVEGAGGLPIFVRLADLGEKTLKDYLLEDWLEEATGKRRIPEDIQEDFVQQFNLGRVWLLLDGVDEIAGSSVSVGARHVVPLQMIASQVKGWVSEARIVLTCRLNVWDVGKNDLYAFEKYRIQQLSYPDAVGDFIRRFFFKAAEPTKGEKLIEKLERSQPRIRDLVKNPLRLTLLCRIWKRRREQEELPRTKAELYKRFVETFYEWKDKPDIDQEKRLLLEQALGELAKNAIDKEVTKFRLRESFVRQELDKFDKSLFDLACRVSWINNVGVAAENPEETVYAFFHPTFQEYFAALAIADWDFFLPRTHDNKNPKPVSERYRIFEPQWKEVILLWLGREEVEKEQFIKELVEFEDGCKYFYRYRAFCLSRLGIAEFRNCSLADEIVSQISQRTSGYFSSEKQEWVVFVEPITEGLRLTLSQLEATENKDICWIYDESLEEVDKSSKPTIVELISSIENTDNEHIRWKAAENFRKIGNGNERAITELARILGTTGSEHIRAIAAYILNEIGKGNERAIAELVQILKTTNNEDIFWRAGDSLREIGKGNEQAIAELAWILETTDNEDIRRLAAESLEQIGKGNERAIAELVRILETSDNQDIREIAACILIGIAKGNKPAIAELVRIVETSNHQDIREIAAYSLEEIDPSNEGMIAEFAQIVETANNEDIREIDAYSLGEIDPDDERAIAELVRILETTDNEDTRWSAAYTLEEIGKGNKELIAELTRILETTDNEDTRWSAAYTLEEIGKGNKELIAELARILETTDNEDTRYIAAYSLGEIDPGNKLAFIALVQILEISDNEDIREIAAYCLGKIDPDNERAITELVRILETSEKKDICRSAAYRLKRILQNNQMPSVVSALQHCLVDEVYETNFDLFSECYEVVWHCAQNMTYPAFYQAWHQQEEVEKTTTSDRQSLNQADLPQNLQSAIANDPQLSQIIHLICIDGSQFIDPDNPAAEIYDQMLDQNCPECDRVPETMPALKLYWNSLKRNSNKRPCLVFYASCTNPYNEAFFTDLSKFKGDICIVTSPPTPLLRGEGSKSGSGSPSSPWGDGVRGWGSLQFFTPSQAIADVMEWIRAIATSA